MHAIDRRDFLRAMLLTAASPLLLRSAPAFADRATLPPATAPPAKLPPATVQLLETSPYVYVSPLRKDGQESSCHGEVWFAWLDGAAVIITARDRWKATSVAAGRDGARLWVGDFGRSKKLLGRDESFRKGPSFEARARVVKDPAVLERLIAVYEKKYPSEIGRWRDRFQSGFASGERVLIAYEPVAV
jgi:hypothetical protein